MSNETLVLPFGPGSIRVSAREGFIEKIEFLRSRRVSPAPRSGLLRAAQREFSSYLKGGLRAFSLPFRLPEHATSFQIAVWRALEHIPYGGVITYGELARRLGSGPRAVGGALKANPLPIILPCHRVVAKNGLGGFAGRDHLAFKVFLLDLEKAFRNKNS